MLRKLQFPCKNVKPNNPIKPCMPEGNIVYLKPSTRIVYHKVQRHDVHRLLYNLQFAMKEMPNEC